MPKYHQSGRPDIFGERRKSAQSSPLENANITRPTEVSRIAMPIEIAHYERPFGGH
jgi:hypothetical protein